MTQFTFVRTGCNLNCILVDPKVDAALFHQLLLCLIFLNVKSQVEHPAPVRSSRAMMWRFLVDVAIGFCCCFSITW